tara:strand:- start:2837 stop:3712 length:876 start_codon:yes stop_codon:yes gene_type:complete
MDTLILKGTPVSIDIKDKLSIEIKKLREKKIIPSLAVILIGNDPASKIYVNNKHKTFKKMNCHSKIFHLDENVEESYLLKLINQLNNDKKIHGILVQLPAPKHLDESKIINSISPNKDVDGLHPVNAGNLIQGEPNFIPCTPLGCIKILDYYNIDTKSKNIVIIGRSNLVGKPLFSLLSQNFKIGNATVTLCHTGTKDLSYFTKRADIIFAAVGKVKLINSEMIKDNVVIVDVGINRINDDTDKGYHIVGDVDYNDVLSKAKAITPVPGGVGVMTVTMLLYNTVQAAKSFT